ncbi:hypothetical protein HanIR_Chr07g0323021 [Helianthus annuus]|nr:hypothetical protein HanIR_Chr07g0323021 [Helianthus annuus]
MSLYSAPSPNPGLISTTISLLVTPPSHRRTISERSSSLRSPNNTNHRSITRSGRSSSSPVQPHLNLRYRGCPASFIMQVVSVLFEDVRAEGGTCGGGKPFGRCW